MFDIYEKEINNAFAGRGAESVIVDEDGNILAHVRGWEDPTVVATGWKPTLIGKRDTDLGKEWVELRGFELENAQAWAVDVLS